MAFSHLAGHPFAQFPVPRIVQSAGCWCLAVIPIHKPYLGSNWPRQKQKMHDIMRNHIRNAKDCTWHSGKWNKLSTAAEAKLQRRIVQSFWSTKSEGTVIISCVSLCSQGSSQGFGRYTSPPFVVEQPSPWDPRPWSWDDELHTCRVRGKLGKGVEVCNAFVKRTW